VAARPELIQVFAIAGRAMRYVLPDRIILNGVVEFPSADSKFDYALSVRTSLSVGVRVSVQDAVLNRGLQPVPFLVRRLALHPPEYYRDVTACTPVLVVQALAAFLIHR
jgi:hypothetical protein